MGIRENEFKLFNELQQKNPDEVIIPDGMVDECSFRASNPKILFLLKEINYPKAPKGWDLRDFLEQEGRKLTWANVARWVLGIRNLNKNMDWETVKMQAEAERTSLLLTIVAMNLKKTPGGTATVYRDMHTWARDNVAELKTQFSFYDPDLIICCGRSTSYVAQDIGLIEPGEKVQASNGVWYMRLPQGPIWITHYHPQARMSHQLMYDKLIAAVREVLPS